MVVEKAGYALLSEKPNEYEKVKVKGQGIDFYEKEEGFLEKNNYKVDYINGWVWFHESMIGKSLNFEYLVEGVFLFHDSRVYYTGEVSFHKIGRSSCRKIICI